MSNLMKAVVFFVVAAFSVLGNTLYVISEFERGITTRFGEIIEADIKPGLHYKLPFLMKCVAFDARILTVDAQPASFFHY